MAEYKKTYKNDILYLRKSKAGNHLYIFNREGQDGKNLLGEGVRSLLINVADLSSLSGDSFVKVSVMREDSAEEI